MTRFLGVLVAALLAWCGVMQPVQASVPTPVAAVATYAYDACHDTAAPTCTTTERGPPAAPHRDIAYAAVGHRPDGALARPEAPISPASTTYDAPARSVQFAHATGATREQGWGSAELRRRSRRVTLPQSPLTNLRISGSGAIRRTSSGVLPATLPRTQPRTGLSSRAPSTLRTSCPRSTLKDGTELLKYYRDLPDGTQAWAYVRNGEITNGGPNVIPR